MGLGGLDWSGAVIKAGPPPVPCLAPGQARDPLPRYPSCPLSPEGRAGRMSSTLQVQAGPGGAEAVSARRPSSIMSACLFCGICAEGIPATSLTEGPGMMEPGLSQPPPSPAAN